MHFPPFFPPFACPFFYGHVKYPFLPVLNVSPSVQIVILVEPSMSSLRRKSGKSSVPSLLVHVFIPTPLLFPPFSSHSLPKKSFDLRLRRAKPEFAQISKKKGKAIHPLVRHGLNLHEPFFWVKLFKF